jgi:hypothetical protein
MPRMPTCIPIDKSNNFLEVAVGCCLLVPLTEVLTEPWWSCMSFQTIKQLLKHGLVWIKLIAFPSGSEYLADIVRCIPPEVLVEPHLRPSIWCESNHLIIQSHRSVLSSNHTIALKCLLQNGDSLLLGYVVIPVRQSSNNPLSSDPNSLVTPAHVLLSVFPFHLVNLNNSVSLLPAELISQAVLQNIQALIALEYVLLGKLPRFAIPDEIAVASGALFLPLAWLRWLTHRQ